MVFIYDMRKKIGYRNVTYSAWAEGLILGGLASGNDASILARAQTAEGGYRGII